MELQLGQYLAACAARTFDWSTWNCAHFFAGWVLQATGRVIVWAPREQAKLRRAFAESVTQRTGLQLVDVADARIGDGMLTSENALGICAGPVIAVLPDGPGVAFVPRALATHAWRVA